MLPTGSGGSGAGLLEKRLFASSGLGLADSVSLIGDYNHSIEDSMLLDSDAEWHNNHASDPGSATLSLVDSVGLIMEMLRPCESTMTLTDSVHVILDGYHPGGGTSTLAITANETVLVGQPVYVSGNNTINLASASSLSEAQAIGLVEVGATANGTANVLTDGTINQADWTSVIGSTNLTPGSVYFLSTTSGKMSTTPPTGDGETVVTIGVAITTTKFDIEVNEVAIL